MKTIKLFLASSIVEFEHERKELGDYIRTLNDHYVECGSDIYIKLEICEDLSNALARERKQEEYNKKIRESDFFYILFGKAAGEYTIEEFDVALEHFKETESPRIYTYFQKLPEGVEPADSVKRFMERLDKEIGHYYSQFSHIDSIKLNMLIEITRSKAVSGKLDIKDGKALLNGKEMLSLENVPIFKNNEGLQKLWEERIVLQKKRAALRARYKENHEDMEARQELSEVAKRINVITEKLHKMEQEILSICSTIAECNSSGRPITFREKEASQCLDAGDYEGALTILRDPMREEELIHSEKVAASGMEGIVGYLNEDSLRIQTLKAKGINTGTLPEIYECYEKCEKIVKKHKIETDIIYEYALFLYNQKAYKTALEKAEWLEKNDDFEKGTGDYKKSELYDLLGDLYRITDRYSESEVYYKKALEIREHLVSESPSVYESDLASSYNSIGIQCFETDRYVEAETYYKKALEIWERLASENPSAYESVLASSYNNLGTLYSDTNRLTEAEEYYNKTLEIYKRLASENPSAYESDLATSYHNLGILYSDTNRLTEAEEYYNKTLEIYKRLASENPSAYESDLATSYHSVGVLYKKTDRYREAEKYYQKAIEIQERLASENPSTYESDLAGSYYNLGILYSDTNRLTEAEEYYKKALEIYKRLASENPSVYANNLAQTYNNMGYLYSCMNRFKTSEAYYKMAISELLLLVIGNPSVYASDLAQSYYNMGKLYSKMNRHTEAEECFQKAIKQKSFERTQNDIFTDNEEGKNLAEDEPESEKNQDDNGNEKSHTGLFGFLRRIFKGQ